KIASNTPRKLCPLQNQKGRKFSHNEILGRCGVTVALVNLITYTALENAPQQAMVCFARIA
ncbi:MAG: hypothetical protein OXG94_10270, partial [Bacteroidetes bacterium]|nr:hypothetical protein [Bacteroidota bacterium]